MPAPNLIRNPFTGRRFGMHAPSLGAVPGQSFDVPVQGGGVQVGQQGTYGGLGRKYGKTPEVFTRQLYGEMPERYGRAERGYGRYENYLEDPTAAGKQFQGFYETAAQGIAAPAMRDFNKELSSVGANVAARFGGNASSEEGRQDYNTSDLFSRNLTEALARLAPQAAQQGLEYGNQLGEAAHGAVGEQDRLTQLILEGMQTKTPKKSNFLAQLLGTAANAAMAYASGGSSAAKGG